jgi:signal transduction histidine kinase
MTAASQEAKSAEQANLEFMDFVAHELKQPMTAIQGYAKMLALGIGGELTETQRQFADVINANTERMGKLVNDLLEISRLEAGRIELQLAPVHIKGIIDEAVESAQAEIDARHHSLEVDVGEGLPALVADGQRLLQILANILHNACIYTPEGGTVRISALGDSHPLVPAGRVRVSISDTGIGMSPAEMDRLGEKFFRSDHDLVRSQRGAGVGVAIARHLIGLHGGELAVESRLDEGSTFHVTLPAAAEPDD